MKKVSMFAVLMLVGMLSVMNSYAWRWNDGTFASVSTRDLTVTSNATFAGSITLGNNVTSPDLAATDDLTVGDSATVNTNLSVGSVLTITGYPKLTTQQAVTGTPVAAASPRLPAGCSTNEGKLLKIQIGTTNYVIAAWPCN